MSKRIACLILTALTVLSLSVPALAADDRGGWSSMAAETRNAALPAPKIVSLTNTANGVAVKWTPVSGAAKYRLYYKTTGGWTRIVETASASYTWSGAKAGTKYRFTVKAFDGAGNAGRYDKVGTAHTYKPVPLAAPKITLAASTSYGVKLSWTPVPGAAKYRLYYKTTGGWTRIAETASASYTWSGAKAGTKYRFTVKAFDGTGNAGSYDRTGTAHTYKPVPLAAPKITLAASTSYGVKLSWAPVSGAAKYRLYYKTTGGWTRIAETASTSYTWSGAKAGTKYRFTVKAFDGAGNAGSYDRTGTALTYKPVSLATPKLTSVADTASGVKLSWTPVSGAAKYRLFYKTTGGWTRFAETASVSYTWSGAKADTKYTFTVRCVSPDGRAYTSAYDRTGRTVEKAKQYLANGLPATDKNVLAVIYSLRDQYPDGTLWDSSSTYYSPWLKTTSGGCFGFALLCSDAAFGSASFRTHTSFDDIRPGDILRVNNGAHSVVALEKTGDGVSVVEGNFDRSVSWGRFFTRQQLEDGDLLVTTRYIE